MGITEKPTVTVQTALGETTVPLMSTVEVYSPPSFSKIVVDPNVSRESISQRELNVILAVVEMSLSQLQDPIPIHGCFELWAKPKLGEETHLIELLLQKGNCCCPGGGGCHHATNAILPLVKMLNGQPSHQNPYPDIRPNVVLPSRIYRGADSLKVLYLETTFGCFLASFYADFEQANFGGIESDAMLVGIATAIAHLRDYDRTLVYAARTILSESVLYSPSRMGVRVAAAVDRMFEDSNHPVVEEWKKWRKDHDTAGNQKLFFE